MAALVVALPQIIIDLPIFTLIHGSLSASEQGTRAASSEMAANGPQPPCTCTVSWCCCQTTLLLSGLSPTILLLFVVSDGLLLLIRTGCPSWCVGNVLTLLDIAAGFLEACLNIVVDVSSAGCRCWMNSRAGNVVLYTEFSRVRPALHWLVGRFGRCG